jgi:hypothetical protein
MHGVPAAANALAVAANPVVFWFHIVTGPVRPVYATLVAVPALPVIEPEGIT